jgi:hypothetical protein
MITSNQLAAVVSFIINLQQTSHLSFHFLTGESSKDMDARSGRRMTLSSGRLPD